MSIVKSVKSGNVVLHLSEFVAGDKFTLKGDNSSSNAEFILNTSNNSYNTKLKTATVTSDISFVLPSNDGNDNQLFTTDGNGNLTFTDNSFNVDQDTSPVLSANLDINSNNFISINNGNISIVPNGSGSILMDGDGTTGTGGVTFENGSIDIKNTGTVSSLSLYCESSNAHYTKIQSSPHSSYSGNVTLTLPTTTSSLGYASEIPHNYGEQSFVASGAISAGNIVGLKSDGTVEVINNVITSYTAARNDVEDIGASNNFTGFAKCLRDPTTNKILVFYRDVHSSSNNLYGKIGTISGNSITFGSAIQIVSDMGASNGKTFDIVYDSNSSQYILIYLNFSGLRVKTRVFTVSATSFTIGTTVSDLPGNYANTPYTNIVAVYDTNVNKIVITVNSNDNQQLGYLYFFVGTLSGTGNSAAVTWGNAHIIWSGNINNWANAISMSFDPNSNKIVFVYDYSNQNTAQVRSLVVNSSANTAAFVPDGNVNLFLPFSQTSQYHRVRDSELIYHPPSNKTILFYADGYDNYLYARTITVPISVANNLAVPTLGSIVTPFSISSNWLVSQDHTFSASYDSYLDKIIIASHGAHYQSSTDPFGIAFGSVSGTNLSFGTAFTLLNPSTNADYTGIYYVDGVYDSNSQKYVVTYYVNGDKIYAALIQPAGSAITGTNADSWIGLAKENISDGATGIINIKNGVNSNQSGLTINTSYYVDRDGSLTTSSTTYGKIGKAISATKLLITQGNA